MLDSASILICTRNRASDLRETLRSISQVQIPDDLRVDLVIVDNGSRDETRSVVECAAMKNFPVSYVFEPSAGKTAACNRGLLESHGQILLWTDDDVRVPRNWIERMCRPIAVGRAKAVAGGFRHPASHLRPWMKRSLAHGNMTDEFLRGPRPHTLIGLNMAFSREVLKVVPGFDLRLGPGALGFGDDTLFALQLEAAGIPIGFVDVQVEHFYPLDRLTRERLLGRAAAVGRSEAYMAYHWLHSPLQNSLSRMYVLKLMLALGRVIWRRECSALEGLEQWEYDLVRRIAFHVQMRSERPSPRRYHRPGPMRALPAR